MKIIGLVLLMALLASCSKVEELDERTEQMADTTEEMNDTTQELKKTTNYMVRLKRQNDAADTRAKQYNILMSTRTGMGQKFTAASIMFKGFEYQLWNPKENTFDSIEFREELKLDAMKELYQRLTDIYNILLQTNFWGNSRLENMTPLDLEQDSNGRNENNMEMIFYALGTTCHYNNIVQVKTAKEKKTIDETESAYDIIRTALDKDANGMNMSEAEEVAVTGTNKQISIELMRARYNMLLGLAAKDIADKDGMSFGNKFSAFFFKLTGGMLGSLTLNSKFEKANNPTQKDVNVKLSAALKTKAILNKAGYSVKVDDDLQSIFKNLRLSDKNKGTTEYRKFLAYLNAVNEN